MTKAVSFYFKSKKRHITICLELNGFFIVRTTDDAFFVAISLFG